MDKFLISSAALMALTTGVHIFAGTPDIMHPILAADLDLVVQGTAVVVWHVISALLALMSLAMLYLARVSNAALSNFVLAVLLTFTGVFLAVTLLSLNSLFALPQWTVFALCAGLMGAARFKAALPRSASTPNDGRGKTFQI